jgi:hypothetical protein
MLVLVHARYYFQLLWLMHYQVGQDISQFYALFLGSLVPCADVGSDK